MNPEDAKLRGLFLIKADQSFSEHHPLWAVIQSFRQHLSEVHVVVFVKGKVSREDRIIQQDGQFFVYHVPEKFFLFNFSYYWTTIQFNLRYRKKFRPDFILSIADGVPAFFGFLLAWSNKRRFFMQASPHLLGHEALSLQHVINKAMLKRATAVFVPGKQTAALFSDLFNIPPAQLIPVEPPFDYHALAHVTDKKDFKIENPQYTFFISSVIYTTKDATALVALHERVRAKYPRTAMIVLVPADMHESIKRLLKHQHAFGMFVYKQDDTLLASLNGTQLYAAISKEQDIDTSMITALGLLIPVVSIDFGIAPELFTGTPYQQFMTPAGDIEAMAASIVTLIEDQRTRGEYALNTGMLLSKVKLVTPEEYAGTVYSVIKEIIQPTLQKVRPIPDLS